jgi:putative FmdB family regulatory protein
MPIYEYQCAKCRRVTSVLTTRIGEKVSGVKCRHCGATNMSRILSRFAMPKSEEARLDALTDPSRLSGFDENDPKSVARMLRNMGREIGDEFSSDEFDEAAEELESSGDLDSGADDDGGDDF